MVLMVRGGGARGGRLKVGATTPIGFHHIEAGVYVGDEIAATHKCTRTHLMGCSTPASPAALSKAARVSANP